AARQDRAGDDRLAARCLLTISGSAPSSSGRPAYAVSAGVRRAVHQVDIVFASSAVSPQDVGPAIAVEIGARDMKGGLGDFRDKGVVVAAGKDGLERPRGDREVARGESRHVGGNSVQGDRLALVIATAAEVGGVDEGGAGR